MIESSFDKIITTLTVRLKDFLNNDYIGSGVIYYQDNFKDKVYILTASHCLFTDGDQFRNQRNEICIDLLKPVRAELHSVPIPISNFWEITAPRTRSSTQ